MTDYANSFVLKGGLIFTVWEIEQRRATRDIDFLGSLERNVEDIVQILKAAVVTLAPEDGLVFDTNTIQGEARLRSNHRIPSFHRRILYHKKNSEASQLRSFKIITQIRLYFAFQCTLLHPTGNLLPGLSYRRQHLR